MEFRLLWWSGLLLSALALVSAVQVADQGFSDEDLASEQRLWALYERWAAQYREEAVEKGTHERRFESFKHNVRYIQRRNKEIQGYYLGLTSFTDLSNTEFKAKHLGGARFPSFLKKLPQKQPFTYNASVKVPAAVNWAENGYVTAVKNQGYCASCWAFSTVATVESLNAINTGSLYDLSEQELVDCDSNNNGCDPGYVNRALQYVVNSGLVTEYAYPYYAVVHQCTVPRNSYRVRIDDYNLVSKCNEYALMQAVAKQPVAVGVEGYGDDFQNYRGGIFKGYCGSSLDHAVVIVGYDSENGEDYWIVKNSWGTNWGQSGYMRILRNTNTECGLCGIATWPFYPIQNGYPIQTLMSKTSTE